MNGIFGSCDSTVSNVVDSSASSELNFAKKAHVDAKFN